MGSLPGGQWIRESGEPCYVTAVRKSGPEADPGELARKQERAERFLGGAVRIHTAIEDAHCVLVVFVPAG